MKCIKMEWNRLLVLKTTFNNIPVLLVGESNVLKENLRLATSHCQTASLNVASSMPYHGWNLELGLWRHFQKYFSYIMAFSFIDGRNRSTRRKPLIAQVVLNPTTIRSWPWQPPKLKEKLIRTYALQLFNA